MSYSFSVTDCKERLQFCLKLYEAVQKMISAVVTKHSKNVVHSDVPWYQKIVEEIKNKVSQPEEAFLLFSKHAD
jgi:hypothetical protein